MWLLSLNKKPSQGVKQIYDMITLGISETTLIAVGLTERSRSGCGESSKVEAAAVFQAKRRLFGLGWWQ